MLFSINFDIVSMLVLSGTRRVPVPDYDPGGVKICREYAVYAIRARIPATT